ncbi:LuxR C-terminal-related transcriptional regulator [Bradyrhizobium sp. USDA 4486]
MLDVSAKQGIFQRNRIVIVDPQPIVLQGLKSILGAQQDFDVVASCRDAASGLEAIRNLTPDVALMADTLPDLTVTEILAIARAENVPTRLVFFTETEANHELAAAIAAGACSAISKYVSPDTMLRVLRLLTKHSVSPQHFDLSPISKATDGTGQIETKLELLTHRERQIVRLVSEGMSNKEIARQLNLSPGTVKVHLYNIFQKLEVTNRTVLATLALLKHPSGFGTLALAFLAVAIADELKASEANDMLPDDDGAGDAAEHAEYEPWKKAILRHLMVYESGETHLLSQTEFLAKLGQVANAPAAMEALRVAEQSAGSKPWKYDGPVGSGTPNLPTPLLRATSDTHLGGELTAEHQFPRLASNPMSVQGKYGTFATLAGALIYALHDPHLAAQAHELGQASNDGFVSVAGEQAATKLAAIPHAGVNHVDNPATGLPSHESRLSSAHVTTAIESVAAEDARTQVSHGASDGVGGDAQKPVASVDAAHEASAGGYGRDQLMAGGNGDGNVVHRSPTDSNSTSSQSGFDFASGPGRLNLAAFGALAWLHMTAASKSIPPHTLAWIYDAASNETIVYVNPTDRVLDIGDRGLLEIHLQGIVSVAEADVADQREALPVAITLEKLEQVLTPASAIDGTVLSKESGDASTGASEGTLGTAGVWAIPADDGSRLQFGQTRTGSGGTERFRTSTGETANATEQSGGASAEPVRVSSIVPAHSATAPAVGNATSNSGPISAETGHPSTGLNVTVQPSLAMADSADRGNSQHSSEQGPAKAAARESTEADSKPGNGVDNGAEHQASDSNVPPGLAKKADSSEAEHGNSEHAKSATGSDAVEESGPSAETAASAGHGKSHHASEKGSAKAAAPEPTEADSKPGHGDGNGAGHHASHSNVPPGLAKKSESSEAEHGHSGHSKSADGSDAAENVVSADSAGHGKSHHASEKASAKAAATESTEADAQPGNRDGHHASGSNVPPGLAKKAESSETEPGNSGHSNTANAPDAAEIDPVVAIAASTGHGHSQHASEKGSAKSAATESTEADSKPGNGVGHGAEHHASPSDAAGTSAAVKTAEPGAVEHGNSGHDVHATSANAPQARDIVDPGFATGDNAGCGNSQHAGGPGSAKAVATELTDVAEQHASASDAASASAAVKTAEPAAAEHGNSEHAAAANAPQAANIVDPSVATGGNAECGNSQQVAQPAATESEDTQSAKAASVTGGADQEQVFRFDSETAPSTLVAIIAPKVLDSPIDPHVPPGQKEHLEMIVKAVPYAPDEHAANHGNSGAHHATIPAHHDLLI